MIRRVQIPLVGELDMAQAAIWENQGVQFRERLTQDHQAALAELDVLLSEGYRIVLSSQFRGERRTWLFVVLHKHENEIPF